MGLVYGIPGLPPDGPVSMAGPISTVSASTLSPPLLLDMSGLVLISLLWYAQCTVKWVLESLKMVIKWPLSRQLYQLAKLANKVFFNLILISPEEKRYEQPIYFFLMVKNKWSKII